MNQHERNVRDNTALIPLTRKLLDGKTVPTAERWTHEERTGILVGRIIQGDVSGWASATSKPFGSWNKPKRPNEDKTLPDDPKSQPIRNLGEIHPIEKRKVESEPQVIVFAAATKFDPEAVAEERNRACIAFAAKADEVFGSLVKRAEVKTVARTKAKVNSKYRPGVLGLDKVRKAKAEPIPAWEREKQERSDLVLYWLTLRSIYRLIYG